MTQSKLAFIFPGQGSQKIGMLSDLATIYPLVSETFAEASSVLGYDLWQLAQAGTQDEINMTERTQPLLLSASVATWRVWQQQGGVRPAYMSGHSLGEWSALVCSGVINFADAVKLVQQRGKFMQEAVPAGQGAMAAIIGLDDSEIISACKKAEEGEVVAAANFNSPGQVVIAGTAAAVARASVLCIEAGARRALPLPVSAPFHTALMAPAADKLANQIREIPFFTPSIPVVHNVSAQTESNPEMIKDLMIQQICSAVRWVDCVNTLCLNGITTTIECGPGKVLSGLNKRINKELVALSMEAPGEVVSALETSY